MILAINNIDIPEYLYHDPSIQSYDEYRVGLHLIDNDLGNSDFYFYDS